MIFGFRRGAPFLTIARLQCLAVDASLRQGDERPPITVQLLGTADDFIAPTDNLDLATGRSFFYIEVDGATHNEIVDLDGEEAVSQFRIALKGDMKSLADKSISLPDVFEGCDEVDDFDVSIMPQANDDVKRVVFVILWHSATGGSGHGALRKGQIGGPRPQRGVPLGDLDLRILSNGAVSAAVGAPRQGRMAIGPVRVGEIAVSARQLFLHRPQQRDLPACEGA